MKPSPRRTAICSSAKKFAAPSTAFSIWSGCWRGSRSTPPARATCARSPPASQTARIEDRAQRDAGSRSGALCRSLDTLEDVTALIETTLVPSRRSRSWMAARLQPAWMPELDELRTISSTGRQSIAPSKSASASAPASAR
jgi:hypothetical protein